MEESEVIALIESAFKNTKLETGVGIFEAEELDRCSSEIQRIKASLRDERLHWNSIPDETIAEHYSVLCFMDSFGLRFHLPAYMRFALKNYRQTTSASVDATINAIDRLAKLPETEFAIFELKQRRAIAKFLEFVVLEIGENYADSWQASQSIEAFWQQYLD